MRGFDDGESSGFGGISLAELAALVSVIILAQRLSTPGGTPRTGPLKIGPQGKGMTLAQVRALAVRVGFPDPDTAAAVAMAESAGDPSAKGDGGNSLGLWQINVPSHPEYAAVPLLDPEQNARAALVVSENGTNWSPWTQYRNGAFRRYMPNV